MPRDPEATAEFVKKMGKGDGADGGPEYADDDRMAVKCPKCGEEFDVPKPGAAKE